MGKYTLTLTSEEFDALRNFLGETYASSLTTVWMKILKAEAGSTP